MKKSLLTESEIRKFMKFANIETLSENFINNSATLEEEAVEEGKHGDDEPMEETLAEEETLEEEMEDPTEFVQDLVDVIMNHLNADITVEKRPAAGEEEEPPMDDMDDMGDEEPMGDMDMGPEGEEAEADMPPSPEMDEEEPMMEDLVNEVTKRVAARLLKENKQ